MRRLAATLLTTAVAGGVMGLAPAAAQTDNTAFCAAALEVETIFNTERFDELDAALTEVESTAPPEIAANVQAVVSIVREALATEEDPSGDPEYESNITAINEYEYNSCGWTQVDVDLLEYEFDGLPKTLPAGPVAMKLTNTGTEVHELAVERQKTKDSIKRLLGLPEKKARKKVEDVAHGLALPGETSYLFADLTKTGRYAALCFIPVGTTDVSMLEDEHGGDGKPHALEGMYQQFKVTRAS